jgi:molecular chaperone GrpE
MSETEELELEQDSPVEEAAAHEVDSDGVNGDTRAQDTEDPQTAELRDLRNELDRALQDQRSMLDKLQRAQAEFENIRKRLQKEKQDVLQYAAADTIQSLLPIIDDFERAIKTEGVSPEFKRGLELIHRRIFEVFTRAGLKEVDQHDSFDPSIHFAVDRAPASEGQCDQQILEVYQKGYRFKDRLIRASMVKVAVQE